jgi:GT2 family glycosyltransferase
MNRIGVIVIGRNEGERLRRCLDSLEGLDATVVYVDSDSTDGSLGLARSRGVEVVELDMSVPFSAARARNAGFGRLLQIDPDVCFIQFLDGDCEVCDGWLDQALRALEDQPRAAVVFGKLRERFPECSLYNRMADIEWNMPIEPVAGRGVALMCGGIAMIRVDAFRAVGGFDPSIPAGEEPELCQRLHRAGWSVVRLDAEMSWHDSGMLRFRQWARRQVRTGYGGLDFAMRFGRRGGPFCRQIRSARFWALGWPSALIVGGSLGAWLGGPIAGGSAVGLLALCFPAQVIRIAARNRTHGGDPCTAFAYGLLTVVGKFFQMSGQCLLLRDRLIGRHARLIEYKFVVPVTEGAASSP